jgi:hypothetical protein
MTVVSDTSPLTNLAAIGRFDLLELLFPGDLPFRPDFRVFVSEAASFVDDAPLDK